LSQGSGGLEEFKKNLKNDEAAFGYVRMIVGNDELVIAKFENRAVGQSFS
jgi:hypothetical protein